MYRQQLARLSTGIILEIEPEAGENLRKIKVNVTRAANELNLAIGYGITTEGTLLVWQKSGLDQSPTDRGERPGRPAG
jgi:hypothetical protein